MAKGKVKIKHKVNIKERELSGGNKSLYLDYSYGGKRHRENLNLYITNSTTIEAIQDNKQALADAEEIRSQKEIDLTRAKNGMPIFKSQKVKIIEFVKKEQSKKEKGTALAWQSVINHIEAHCINVQSFLLTDINLDFCNGFILHLKDKLSSANSQREYLNKFKTMVKQAITEGYIYDVGLLNKIDKIKPIDTEIVYLVEPEVKTLFQDLDMKQTVQRAFLFSCLTGLRFADVKKLTTSNIQDTGLGKALVFTQSKTKKLQTLGLTNQVVSLMGTLPVDAETPLFPLGYAVTENRRLNAWTKKNKINKYFTYHTSRHTFACMQLTFGTDLYTLSKLMGHTSIVHTQRYARVLDKTKVDAMNKFPLFV